jgi:flavodoxin
MISMRYDKVLIICGSYHHGSTMKVAKVMAEELGALVVGPDEADAGAIPNFDLIGFGSGIYNRKHDIKIFELLERLDPQEKKKAFVFSTNSFGLKILHKPLIEKLKEKGFEVIGEFACKGFMDFSFTKYIFGGLNKTRPDRGDLERARAFAKQLA